MFTQTSRRLVTTGLAALGLMLGVIHCGRKQESQPAAAHPAPAAATPARQPSPAPAAQAAPAAPAAAPMPAQAVLASQPYNQNPDLRCDILEVRRVSGGALLIKWRLSRPAAAGGGGLVAGQQAPPVWHTCSWDGAYYTDPAENKKYSGLKDSAGQWIAQGDSKHYSPGDQQVIWMKFPAPPPTSTKITFVFPGFPPFEDLPVS